MKYMISVNCTFGWDYTIYDTDTMTRTRHSGCGDYETVKQETVTKAEMQQFINDRQTAELKNLHYEMTKIQERYDKIFAEIEKFKKALDNR